MSAEQGRRGRARRHGPARLLPRARGATWSTDAVGSTTATRQLDRYRHFSRAEWAQLKSFTPLRITEAERQRIISFNDALSPEEASDIYLPLTRLLNLYVGAKQQLHHATDEFLSRTSRRVPFVIGIAGSVAVGKSTTARLLELLLARWSDHPRVDLVTTDGFLFPTAELTARGLMGRKGFPESYDTRRLLEFLADVKAGCPVVRAPVYSHLAYDIVPDQYQVVRQPDILIVEGLNVLQGPDQRSLEQHRPVVADFFDYSDLRRRGRGGHRALVRRAVPRLPQDGVRRRAVVLPPLRQASAPRRRSRPPGASGRRSTRSTCGRTSSPPGSGPTSSSRRAPTTPSPPSTSASPRGQPGCGGRPAGSSALTAVVGARDPPGRSSAWGPSPLGPEHS